MADEQPPIEEPTSVFEQPEAAPQNDVEETNNAEHEEQSAAIETEAPTIDTEQVLAEGSELKQPEATMDVESEGENGEEKRAEDVAEAVAGEGEATDINAVENSDQVEGGGDGDGGEDAAADEEAGEDGGEGGEEEGMGGEEDAGEDAGGEDDEGLDAAEDGENVELEELDEETQRMVALNSIEYDVSTMRPKAPEGQYNLESIRLYHSFGFECLRRNVLHLLGDDTLLTTSGTSVMLLNLNTLEQKYLPGLDGEGIGALAVHPSGQYFAVGEKGFDPNIYIYEYPSLRLVRVLRKGTERAFSDLAWNSQGDKLASVGSYPDYLLHVWNWMEEAIVLRAKAFSQDVYRVSFSPRDDGILYTSGTGHIRFWKMAQTFTGLKLQGDLGKFGNVELSDISSYVEFPDGKVLSGTETGSMLLWDGNLIKVEIIRGFGDGGEEQNDRICCHKGMIEQMWLDAKADSKTIVTAGVDGFIRFWNFDALDQAQPGENSALCLIEPVSEIQIGSGIGREVQIKNIHRGENEWIIQDGCGALWRLLLPRMDARPLIAFHAGSINGMDLCASKHFAATTGDDGTVRVYDYTSRKLLVTQQFSAAGTALCFAPRALDNSCMSFIAGFADGVVRMLQIGPGGSTLELVKAFKPHTKKVTCMSFCPDGRTLVTGGEDNTLFFMAAEHEFAAIGFVNVENPQGGKTIPRDISWSADWDKILCVMEDASVFEYATPNPTEIDPSRASFEIHLEFRTFNFEREPIPKPVKKKKPEVRDDDDYSADEEAKLKAEIAKIEEEEAREQMEYEQKVAEREAFATAAGPPLGRRVMYSGEDTFYAAFDGAWKGPIWECRFGEKYPIRQFDSGKDTTVCLTRSISKRWLISGSKDGHVRLRPWSNNLLLEKSWSKTLHDRDAGAVNAACLSHDDTFLVTAGADGNLQAFMLSPDLLSQAASDMADREAQKAAEMAKLLERKLQDETRRKEQEDMDREAAEAAAAASAAASAAAAPAVEGDIIDPKHYSIEEEKQKAEEDKKIAAAEEKKAQVRVHIEEIRREFLALLEANAQLPPSERISREEFELDQDLRILLEREAAKKVEEARSKLAWISEKKTLQLAKIKSAFLDDVAVERIVMKAFKSAHSVSTFRTRKLTAQQRANIDSVHALISQEENSRTRQDGGSVSGGGGKYGGVSLSVSLDAHGGASHPATAADAGPVKEHGNIGGHDGKEGSVSKAEMRKQQRAEMQKQWEKLMSSKPDDQYEDMNDVAAIAWAEQNMGDYKLKTDPDFVVPEHQRINAEKKKRQMVLLEESVYSIKMGFNERFLALRDLKLRIVNSIKRDNERLRQLNALLIQNTPAPPGAVVPVIPEPWQPMIDDAEWPERREEYTQADLDEFEKKREAEERAAKGHGGPGFSDAPAETEKVDPKDKKGAKNIAGKKGAKQRKGRVERDEEEEEDKETEDGEGGESAAKAQEQKGPVLEEVPKSELEEAEEYARRKRLTYERDQLSEKINKTVTAFDEALMNLRREKFKLEADLKTTDLKMLVLYQELRLLKDFEKKDNSLAQKLEAKRMEKAEIVSKIAECQEKLANKKVEIDRLNPKQVYQQFTQVVPENNKFYEDLLKIFKKKIKRIKKKTKADAADEEEEENSENENSEEDDDMSDLDNEEEDEEEEFCPPGCDPALYESVCELREKRLDQEEILNEFQKSVESLKKENDALGKKEKVIDGSLRQCETEIQQFQTFKQQRLNEIDVVICLKMHQIQCLVDNKLPANLSHTIVFTNQGLTRLQERIKELQNEKVELRKQQKQLRKEHVQLMKSKRVKEQRLSELEARARDVQMLKFGQEIDLDTLEQMAVNRTAEELRAQLKKQEAHAQHELEVWKQRIEEASAELARVTISNTDKLERVAELTAQQHKLEKELNSTQTRMVAEVGPSKEAMKMEREQLVNLVKLQAKEMEALKAEINMLRRKGGHVYTPVMRQKHDAAL